MNLRVRPRVKTVIGFHIVDMKKGVILLGQGHPSRSQNFHIMVSLIKKLLIMFLSVIV